MFLNGDHPLFKRCLIVFISAFLFHRQSVYRHGLRQLHPFKRGAWTEEECEALVSFVQRMGKKWAAIQQKLNRSADSCRDKYRYVTPISRLQYVVAFADLRICLTLSTLLSYYNVETNREMNDEYVRGRWKETETDTLKKIIREHLTAEPNADIKELGKMVEAEGIKIPWSSISQRMGKRSRLSCFKKWQKMTGLFSPSDVHKKPMGDEAKGSRKPAASASVNNPIRETQEDYDAYLLTELANLNVARASEVTWESIRLENAQERWGELLEELQSSNDESIMSLRLSEIAQLLLERKTSAERAAETVEAVDLPPPEALNTREI